MKRRALLVAKRATFLAAIAGVFVLMALAVLVREVVTLATSGSETADATPVIAAEVADEPFADIITAVGTAHANESVAVTSKISDTISRINFDSGDFVQGGQVLAELVDAEEAASLNAARATLTEARRERDRAAELAQRGVAPAQRRDEAESEFQRAAAQVTAIEARMADRIIRAPFAGVVGLRNISAGELIDTGTVIATLNDVRVIKLDFALPERFLATVQAGQRVDARASAYPGEIFNGRITNIDNQVDRVSRAVTVRAEIPNTDGRLVPGMLLSVEVRRDERERPAIPESALMRMAEQAYVFVLEPGEDEGLHIARRRDVEPGLRAQGRVEILNGLEAGETVIADGTHRTRDGGPVRISEMRAPRPAAPESEPAPETDPAPDAQPAPETEPATGALPAPFELPAGETPEEALADDEAELPPPDPDPEPAAEPAPEPVTPPASAGAGG